LLTEQDRQEIAAGPWFRDPQRLLAHVGALLDEQPSLLPQFIDLAVKKAHEHRQQGRLRKAVEAAGRASPTKNRAKRWTDARYLELLTAAEVLQRTGVRGDKRDAAMRAVFGLDGQSLANRLRQARLAIYSRKQQSSKAR